MREDRNLIWTKKFYLFLIITALYFINNYMLNPIIAGYTSFLGGNGAIIGLISGAMSFVALILTPITGPLVDRFNRKLLAVLSFSLLLAANILFYITKNTEILLAARVIQGIGFSFASVVMSTSVSTMFPSKVVGKAISIYASVQALAQAIGPSIGLMVRNKLGYPSTFFLAMLLTIGCLVLTLLAQDFGKMPEQPKTLRFRFNEIIAVNVLPLAITSVVSGFLLHIIQSYLDPVAELRGQTAGVSLFFTVYACAMLLSRVCLSNLMDRKSIGEFLIVCCPMIAVSFYLIQIQTNALILWLGGILCAVGLGTMQVMSQVSLVKNVEKGLTIHHKKF